MTKTKILLVDDEPLILDLLSFHLQKNNYEVCSTDNGADAIRIAQNFLPDLILLDRMMPEKDGLATLQALRKNEKLKHTNVIFLTAMAVESDEIEGLQEGADDYLSKPIKIDLLLTRIQAVLRRNNKQNTIEESLIQHGSLIINKAAYTVQYQQQDFSLAKKEFELLALMAAQPGKVFLRQEILDKIWGTEVIVGDRTIDVHIRKIRAKLNANFIQTLKGVGYKFELPKVQ